jgi:hypothetical protein
MKSSQVIEQTATTNEKIYDNPTNNNNVFYRRNPDINDETKSSEAKITHKSEIIDPTKSLSNCESQVEITTSSSQQQQQHPASYIYSQVYPV